MRKYAGVFFVILSLMYACDSRSMKSVESFDMRDVQILNDTGIITEDILTTDTSDIYEPPLKLIFEADNQRPLYGEVALVPSVTDDKIMVVDMLLGGDDNMKLSFYGLYYRLSFPEEVLEVETITAHPDLPAGIINKFSVRKGELFGVITNRGETEMFSLRCKKPLISVRFKIKMIKTGRIDIITSKTGILDDKLKPVVSNYFGGKLSIVQK
ncbi:MAG: hypothetical protein N3B13_02860 [Deltaproteobacteria bacterium]|nr:hypothetical protein [Deltaproteobacteria bacterium]